MTPQELANQKAALWRSFELDNDTLAAITALENTDPKEFVDSFYTDLEFGTGGLRGLMGVGSNRMNQYTIGMATQGLANYMLSQATADQALRVAIAYDARNNSAYFAQIAAQTLAANDIEVYLFDELRPTPLLSFTVRELSCMAGIVITASHNPKEYNGYKVYWAHGGQILPPHDSGIIAEVRKLNNWSEVKTNFSSEKIKSVPLAIEAAYIERVQNLCLSQDAIHAHSDLSIVYTPIHGSGITLVPKVLIALGFQNVAIVAEQATPDGNFSTVSSPNPEERAAMQMALALGDRTSAALVMGTDPDTDRVGIAVRDTKGRLQLLNGNQAGSLLVYYRLLLSKANKTLPANGFIGKTIVTTELIARIAASFDVPCYNTLTGFKYIAGLIKEKEGKEVFIAGGEESYGYLVSDFVRDKDAALSAAQFAEMAAYARSINSSLWQLLCQLYVQHGVYAEDLVSITLKGIDGLAQIKNLMHQFRNNPPIKLGGSLVQKIEDYQSQESKDCVTGQCTKISLPSSNVLQFHLADGSKISIRPSGTEPKIKFYLSLRKEIKKTWEVEEALKQLQTRIGLIRSELGVN
jgi:phosphoglucomutase